MTEIEIAENFHRAREQIANAEKSSGRREGSVKLCAVSKFHPAEDVMAAIKANQFLFGENRVQEAYGKFNSDLLKNQDCHLHIIGQLQSNKVKKAVEVGATNLTHTYNAMKPLHHREVGTVGSGFLFDELNCECPKEIANDVAKQLHSLMVKAGAIFCTRCKLDADISYDKDGNLPTYWIH